MRNHTIRMFLGGLLYIMSIATSAQTTFQKSYSNGGFEKGSVVIKTSDGGYLEGGTTGTGVFGPDKIYLVKTDFAGGVLWSKIIGGTVSEYLASVIQTADGGYMLCGTTFSFNTQPYGNILLIKTDASGNIVWQNHYGYTGYDYGYSVQQTPDGGYIVGGLTSSFGAGAYDYFIMKIDSVGYGAWGTTIGGTGNDEGFSVLQTADGGYMIVGQENSYSFTMINPYHIMLCKLNASGTVLWSKGYGGGNAGGNYIGSMLRSTTDGGYVITGWTDGVGAGVQDAILVKVDSAGTLQWSKTYGGVNSDFGNDVRQTNDGGYAIAGYTKSFGAGNDDAYLIRTDGSGNLIWSMCYGDTAIDRANSLDQTSDNGFIIAGQTSATGASNADFYLIKTDASGATGCMENDPLTQAASQTLFTFNITPVITSNALWTYAFATSTSGCVPTTLCSTVGIDEPTAVSSILNVFPNPATGNFTVQSAIMNHATLEIFDNSGRIVFANNNFNGQQDIHLINCSPGLYLIKLSNEENVTVQTVTIE